MGLMTMDFSRQLLFWGKLKELTLRIAAATFSVVIRLMP